MLRHFIQLSTEFVFLHALLCNRRGPSFSAFFFDRPFSFLKPSLRIVFDLLELLLSNMLESAIEMNNYEPQTSKQRSMTACGDGVNHTARMDKDALDLAKLGKAAVLKVSEAPQLRCFS